MTMRYVLIGDCESPHMLKWARALKPHVELHAISNRGFLPAFEELVPRERRLRLNANTNVEGGNFASLKSLPAMARWLRIVRPDVLHAHYLTSSGTLAWLAQRLLGAGGLLVGSAWGSDVLVTPWRSWFMRWLTSRVLRACDLTTSDSQEMARRMAELGARDVMVFPFGLEEMPPEPVGKIDHRFFANRGIEPNYDPERVIDLFASASSRWTDARMAVARDGPLMPAVRERVLALGLAERVEFTGFLDPVRHAREYAAARWYVSLPHSDSVSVSVLEAMAHGCIPILSDLPANRELVESGRNGLIVDTGAMPQPEQLESLLADSAAIASRNRAWIREHALFGPCVDRFLLRVRTLRDARLGSVA